MKISATSVLKWLKARYSLRAEGKSAPESQQWELTEDERSAYQRTLAQKCAQADVIDDRTWSDLEMEKIHLRFNKCVTPLGAQYLYALLRNYQTNRAGLEANVASYQIFKSDTNVTKSLQRALARLNRRESAEVADFLTGPPISIPGRYRFFYIASALTIGCTFGIFFSPWFLPVSLVLWSLNIVLHFVYGTKLIRHSPALTSLAILLGSVPKISQSIQGTDLPELRELEASAEIAKKIQSQISLAFLRREGSDDLFRILIEYLNLLCLFEVNALCRALMAVNRERQVLLNIFHQVARLDALQAIAGVLSEYPSVCVPEVTAGRAFSLVNVQHLLVSNPVCNTIQGTGNSLLLTGTNMAGKTTFIKTVAVNLLFAQTLGVCLASKAVLPPARVRALIAREDIITSGQSYFYFEASELLRMLKDAERNDREYWFVLDEIFRGTNTVERVAAGSAVLNHLHGCGFVIVSTHDHELTHLLKKDFDLYHFSEVINDKEVKFDYLLRKGPCTTRNAIKLLAMAGFPKEVTDSAERQATIANLATARESNGILGVARDNEART